MKHFYKNTIVNELPQGVKPCEKFIQQNYFPLSEEMEVFYTLYPTVSVTEIFNCKLLYSTILELFDVQKAKNDMMTNFGIRIATVAPYTAVLLDMLGNKNFKGIKDYVRLLIIKSIVTADDYNSVNEALKKQGVNLDTL